MTDTQTFITITLIALAAGFPGELLYYLNALRRALKTLIKTLRRP